MVELSAIQDYYELGVILTRKKLFTQATKNLEKAKKLWDGEESDLAQVGMAKQPRPPALLTSPNAAAVLAECARCLPLAWLQRLPTPFACIKNMGTHIACCEDELEQGAHLERIPDDSAHHPDWSANRPAGWQGMTPVSFSTWQHAQRRFVWQVCVAHYPGPLTDSYLSMPMDDDMCFTTNNTCSLHLISSSGAQCSGLLLLQHGEN